ncbi:signal peptidase I [Cytobacillus kochii]
MKFFMKGESFILLSLAKWTLRLIGNLLFLLICVLLFIMLFARFTGNEPNLFGYQVKTVLSGSMEPLFKTGSVIAINRTEENQTYQTGDIITFKLDEILITHRIVETSLKDGAITYKTKGDNNDAIDRWEVPAHHVVGEYAGVTIPYLGYVLHTAQTKAGAALLMIIPGIILLFSAFVQPGERKPKEVYTQ